MNASPWQVSEDNQWSPGVAESVFAVGNGFVGLRGRPEEDGAASACFVNGFYETWDISYPETAYGFARQGQAIIPAPDVTRVALTVDGQRLAGDPIEQHRLLDMAAGVMTRRTLWATPAGIVEVRAKRLVSFTRRGLVALQLDITPVGHPAEVVIAHGLTLPLPAGQAGSAPHDPRAGTVLGNQLTAVYSHDGPRLDVRTARSGVGLRIESHHEVSLSHQDDPTAVGAPAGPERPDASSPRGQVAGCDQPAAAVAPAQTGAVSPILEDSWRGPADQSGTNSYRDGVGAVERGDSGNWEPVCPVFPGNQAAPMTQWQLRLEAGQTARLIVTGWYQPLAAEKSPADDQESWPGGDVEGSAGGDTEPVSWEELAAEQRRWLDDFWDKADILIDEGRDQQLQQAVRWSLFQAIQGSARADGQGVAAKGVTGPGYDGHYFWDMEMYVLPLLTYVAPAVARAALTYRLRTLPQARARAAELHLDGALFPWRTISGQEASAYFEAGTAQFHIDADIACALTRYVAATGDRGLLAAGGAQVLAETARLWASLGFFGDDGAFHLHCVTGPDEYSALVDDNVYTNLMARANLLAAVRDGAAPQAEAARWQQMAKAMFVPYDSGRRLHPQDAHFLEQEVWDLAEVPPENFPLLLHYHPLTIYRRQVLKQADLVLAQITCPEAFTPAQKRANFDYYDKLTTGDSSLSAVPQAIAAAEVGHLDLAQRYLRTAALVDLTNSHGNTDAGVHIAVAAGVWSALVMGFGGLRDADQTLRLWPQLAPDWRRLQFSLLWRGSCLRVDVTPGQARLSVDGLVAVSLTVWGQPVQVLPGQPVIVRR